MQVLFIAFLLLCQCQNAVQFDAKQPLAIAISNHGTPEEKQIWRSDNEGDTWEGLSNGLPADAGIWRVMQSSDKLILLAGKSLYERSLSDIVLTNWSETYYSMENISDIDQDKEGLLILAYEKGVFRNLPGSTTLLPLHTNLPDLHVRGYTNTSFGIFFSAESGLYRSTDQGATWLQVFRGGFANKVVQQTDALFTTTDYGVMKSVDGGKNWQVIDAAGQPTAPITQYKTHLACISDDIKGKERKWGQSLRYSPDGGNTWRQLEKNLPAYDRINDFAMNDQFMYCSTNTGVYRSADAGKSWKMVHAPSDKEGGYLDIIVVGKTVYLIQVVGC